MTRKSIRTRYMAATLFLFAVLAVASPPALKSQDHSGSRTVTVIGTGRIINGDITTARRQAISDSLVTAVGLVSSDLLNHLVIIESFKDLNRLVLSDAGAFLQYKVLTETTTRQIYRVMVEANVSVSSIQNLLTQNGILLQNTTPLRVLLLISEKGLDASSYGSWWEDPFEASIAESALADTLSSQGLVVIDHGQILPPVLAAPPAGIWMPSESKLTADRAVLFGEWFNADVVLVGSALSEQAPNTLGDELRSYRGTLSVKALRTDTGEVLAQSDRNILTTGTDDDTGSRRALMEAGARTGALLAVEIQNIWQQTEGTGSVLATIAVKGGYQLAHFVTFRRMLSEIPGVSDLKTNRITPSETILDIEYDGTTQALAEALLLKSFGDFGIYITSTTPGGLRLSLVPN